MRRRGAGKDQAPPHTLDAFVQPTEDLLELIQMYGGYGGYGGTEVRSRTDTAR